MLKNFSVNSYLNFKNFTKKSVQLFISRCSIFFVFFEVIGVFKIYDSQLKKNSKNRYILSKSNQNTIKIELIQEILFSLNTILINYDLNDNFLYKMCLNKCTLLGPNRNYFLIKTVKYLAINIFCKKYNNIIKDMLNRNYLENFPRSNYICITKIFNFKLNNKNFSRIKDFYFKLNYLSYRNFFLIQQIFLENNLLFNGCLIQLIFLLSLDKLDNFFKRKALKQLCICLRVFFIKFNLNFSKNLKLLNENNKQNFLIEKNKTNRKLYMITKKFQFFFKLLLFHQKKTIGYIYTALKIFFLTILPGVIFNVQFNFVFFLSFYKFLKVLNKIKYISRKIKKTWFKKILFIKYIQFEMINKILTYQKLYKKLHTWSNVLKIIYTKRDDFFFEIKCFEYILDQSEFSVIAKTNNNFLKLRIS
nr:hypothetical protein CparaKRNrm1_p042 [Cryptomonas paramecium]